MKPVKRPLKWLLTLIAAEMALVALITVLFDPFYQYHATLPGTETVLYDRDNQVPGTIRTFEYDSVLLGSSVAENFDSDYLDTMYNGKFIKIIRASSSIADLRYYMDQAHEEQEITNVFWCLDLFAFTFSTEVTLYAGNIPRYLHTDTIFDDFTYLFNKEILFEKIPFSLACSYLGRNTGGEAYNWAADKTFGAESAMRSYNKPAGNFSDSGVVSPENKELIDTNLAMALDEITSHPETQYTIVLPPYSLLWWDSGYVNELSSAYLYAMEQVLTTFVPLENVTVHFFMNERNIICDLNYYMDMLHYSPEINQYMLECVSKGSHLVTEENLNEVISDMNETVDYIVTEKIYDYYPKQ